MDPNQQPMMPMTPPEAPMEPGVVAGGTQDVGPEARQELTRLLEQLQNKRGEFNAMQFASKNATESQRQEALMQVFDIMQQNGVDPSNVEEVKAFLDQLEQANPELYQIFVEAFNLLIGEGGEIPLDNGSAPDAMPPELPNAPGGPADLSGALSPGAPGGMPPPPGGIAAKFPGLAQ